MGGAYFPPRVCGGFDGAGWGGGGGGRGMVWGVSVARSRVRRAGRFWTVAMGRVFALVVGQ